MEVNVIDYKNLPATSPLNFTLIIYILNDNYGAPEWLWSVSIMVIVLLWASFIYMKRKQEVVDIFEKEDNTEEEDNKESTPKKSKFQTKLEELQNK